MIFDIFSCESFLILFCDWVRVLSEKIPLLWQFHKATLIALFLKQSVNGCNLLQDNSFLVISKEFNISNVKASDLDL